MLKLNPSNFFIAIPEIYIVIVSLVILIFGIFYQIKDYNDKILFFNKLYYTVILAIMLSLFLMYSIGGIYVETFEGMFISSIYIYLFKIILIIFIIFITILSRRYLIDKNIFQYEYIVIILLFLVSCLLLVSSNDFLAFYISLELLTICSYALIFMYKGSSRSNSAGIKYFLLSALGTGFLLYGISLIYGYTGYTNFIDIKNFLEGKDNNLIIMLGLVMLIVGIGFKLSLVPFHMWTPDVYKGINKFLILLFTVIAKFSVLFIFIRILWEPLYYLQHQWSFIIKFLIITSSTLGYIVAIYQKNFKVFIAYSSIANMSYILLAALAPSDSNMLSIIFYIVAYSVAIIGFLGCLMIIKKDRKTVENIDDIQGLYHKSPYLAFTISVFLISMAGLPITAGFFGKLVVIYTVLQNGNYFLLTYVVLLTVVLMYYYFKVINIMYFFPMSDKSEITYYTGKSIFDIKIIIFILLVFTLAIMLLMKPFILFMDSFL